MGAEVIAEDFDPVLVLVVETFARDTVNSMYASSAMGSLPEGLIFRFSLPVGGANPTRTSAWRYPTTPFSDVSADWPQE
jgi:hypothetical protein